MCKMVVYKHTGFLLVTYVELINTLCNLSCVLIKSRIVLLIVFYTLIISNRKIIFVFIKQFGAVFVTVPKPICNRYNIYIIQLHICLIQNILDTLFCTTSFLLEASYSFSCNSRNKMAIFYNRL